MACQTKEANQTINCSLTLDTPNPASLINLHISLMVFNAACSMLTTTCNAIVIYTILKTPSLQKPSDYLMLGLAIADLGVGVLVQPSFCVMVVCILLGEYKCVHSSISMYVNGGWALGTASIWTLAALTTDRFIAITCHLRYREIVTVRRTCVVYAMICILAIASGVSKSSLSILFSLLSILTVILFIITICLMVKIQLVIFNHSKQIEVQYRQQNVYISRMKKNMNIMNYIIGAFVVCYLPFFVLMVLNRFTNFTFDLPAIFIIYRISEVLVFLNSLLNPVIYFWRITELRDAARNVMRRLFKLDVAAP